MIALTRFFYILQRGMLVRHIKILLSTKCESKMTRMYIALIVLCCDWFISLELIFNIRAEKSVIAVREMLVNQ